MILYVYIFYFFFYIYVFLHFDFICFFLNNYLRFIIIYLILILKKSTPDTPIPVSAAGYIRSPDNPELFIQCIPDLACPGNDQCAEGYTGRGCGECAKSNCHCKCDF